jgi:hypothetical protein
VFNHDGSEIVATYNDDDIFLFDTRHSDGADYVHKYEGHRNSSTGMYFLIKFIVFLLSNCVFYVMLNFITLIFYFIFYAALFLAIA